MPREFDPRSEYHFPLLIIKAVEPGCTTEVQIEFVDTGRIIRLTTAEDGAADDAMLEREVLSAWRQAWAWYQEGK